MRERRDSISLFGGDCEMDAAAEIDAVGAVVDLDQHRERVASRRSPRALPRATASAVSRLISPEIESAVEAERRGDFGRVAGDETAAEHLLGSGQVGDAGGDLAGGEGLDHRERAIARGERG